MSDLTIEDSAPPPKVTRPAKVLGPATEKERVTILIPKTERDTRDVFVSANFVSYQIKRGVPVSVPRIVATVLESAIETRYYPEHDEKLGRDVMVPREVMSYPFQYVSAPAA